MAMLETHNVGWNGPGAPVVLDDGGRLASDFPCDRCGYNLKTLQVVRVCPECGFSIGASIYENKSPQSAWTPVAAAGVWIFFGLMLLAMSLPAVLAPTQCGPVVKPPTYVVLRSDRLASPITVRSWANGCLLFQDGHTFQIAGLEEVPVDSPGMQAVLKKGVEIDADGRVFCLVPVASELFRTDLKQLLEYHTSGDCETCDGTFNQLDWTPSDYNRFERWANEASRPRWYPPVVVCE